MGKQFSIYLDEVAAERLTAKATVECRRPTDQARYIILKSLGLVTDDGSGTDKMNNRQAASTLTEASSKAVAIVNP